MTRRENHRERERGWGVANREKHRKEKRRARELERTEGLACSYNSMAGFFF